MTDSTARTAYKALTALDGQEAVIERRHRRHLWHLALFFGYFAISIPVFYFLEGWRPLHTTLFTMSIVTGVGYGHVAPSGDFSMVLTTVWIVAGLCVFATVAGQVLDFAVQRQVNASVELLEKMEDVNHVLGFRERQKAVKLSHFLAGLLNVSAFYIFAVLLFVSYFGEGWCRAVYLAAISVLKLDSLCLLDGVHCSAGWQSSEGGQRLDEILAIIWGIVTFGVVGHFFVTAAAYLGDDPEPTLTRVKKITEERFSRMDADGDGIVRRAEFLRDRLIQGGLCSAEEIDRILKNFDVLDKDKSGFVNSADLA